jgi:hypothetical protein
MSSWDRLLLSPSSSSSGSAWDELLTPRSMSNVSSPTASDEVAPSSDWDRFAGSSASCFGCSRRRSKDIGDRILEHANIAAGTQRLKADAAPAHPSAVAATPTTASVVTS